ncbi:hypothetical protein HIM_08966 [Hirsutella minnesotensis 3608]|uniref:Uncharacterized protein n=1 Tax=Hirsutella minnesotensis 3608 TaxID=1043627 RepID=A0A0F8A3D8_9HYPO|nr:hypothetical protein HIM_08966 [Hirsutella minnesotensis 3608]
MPDLNSVPPSPHALASSSSASLRRRSSAQMMPPPPVPVSPSLNILPSNQGVVVRRHSRSGSVPSPQLSASYPLQPQNQNQAQPAMADSGVGPGPGPLRHPRPLTASELHMQLEKEQEAVVNRLTRELSLLRAAQNASVVSNASSTSATPSTHEPAADSSLFSGSGFSIPTSRRHHRNSSSASQMPSMQLGSSYEARIRQPALPLSRQDSAASRRSRANSPGPQPSSIDPSSYFHNQRVPPVASSVPASSVAATPGSTAFTEQTSPGLMPGTSRYEETAFYRGELESAKKENEALKRRIRELERMVQSRRASSVGRPPSEAASATPGAATTPVGASSTPDAQVQGASRPERRRGLTSQSVASVASLGLGVPEDEVKVGESAASSGLANNP